MWEVTLLSTWSSAGGKPLADLGPTHDGTERVYSIGARGTWTLVLDRQIAGSLLRGRDIVRVTRHERGDYHELRLMQRGAPTRGVEGERVTFTGYPRLYDFADSDLVYEMVNGAEVYSFDVEGTARAILERFVFVRQAADGLAGIVLGTVPDVVARRYQFSRWTRLQLLDAVLAAEFCEPVWSYQEDGSERLDLVADQGASAPVVPLAYGDRLTDHTESEDVQALATVTRLAGEKPTPDSEAAGFGENAWRVAGRRTLTDGRMAVELREIGGARSPILQDGMYAADATIGLPARYLQRADGTSRTPVLASSAALSEVTVTAAQAPLVGEIVTIVADAQGTPLEVIELPAAIRRFGRVVADQQVPGGRGERNYARNGGHEQGLLDWSPFNGGVGVEFLRSELGRTLVGAANASRAAGIGTGTPFVVKLLTPGDFVRRTDRLEIEGAVLDILANAVPGTDGVLALTLEAPGLPGSYADGAPITLVRQDQRTLTVEQVVPRFAGYVVCSGTDLAELTDFWESADFAVTGPNGETYLPSTGADVRVFRWPDDPTWCVLQHRAGWSDTLNENPLGIHAITGSVSVVSAKRLAVTLDPTYALGSLNGAGQYVTLSLTVSGPDALVMALPPWLQASAGGLQVAAQVVSLVGNVLTVDVVGLPSATTFVGLTLTARPNWYPVSGSLTPWVSAVYSWGLTFAVDALFDVVRRKERRTLYFDGPHAASDTTISLRPSLAQLTQLQRRDWSTADSLTHRRELTATVRITAFNDSTYEATLDLGASTLDEVASADRDGIALLWIPSTAVALELDVVGGSPPGFIPNWPWRVLSLSGSTLQLQPDLAAIGSMFGVPPYDVTITSVTDLGGWARTLHCDWGLEDTYAVTGVASFNADGIAAVPVSIPSGRTLPVGTVLTANWMPVRETSLLRVATTVTGPASSVSVRGDDAYRSTWDGVTAALTAVYRVFGVAGGGRSRLDVPGDVLHAAASVQVNGSGLASVTLAAANTNDIPADAVVRIVRPVLLGPTDRQTGSIMRLVCAPGSSPNSSTPGMLCKREWFRVPPNALRTLTARSRFRLSIDDWTAGEGPAVALVNEAGQILNVAMLDDDGVVIDAEAGQVEVAVQATLTTSGRYGLVVFGGPSADLTKWCLHDQTMFTLGPAQDVPYLDGSYPALSLLTVARTLLERAEPRVSDTLSIEELSVAYAEALGFAASVPRLTLGGRVHLVRQDRLARITTLIERPEPLIARVEIGQVMRDGALILGDAALRAGAGGNR